MYRYLRYKGVDLVPEQLDRGDEMRSVCADLTHTYSLRLDAPAFLLSAAFGSPPVPLTRRQRITRLVKSAARRFPLVIIRRSTLDDLEDQW